MSVPEFPAGESDNLGSTMPAGSDQQHVAATPDAHDLPIAPDLGLTALLASDQAGPGPSSDVGLVADGHAYDGHVALVLDADVQPDIESTLDFLTTSHHLFDVPAMDVAMTTDDGAAS